MESDTNSIYSSSPQNIVIVWASLWVCVLEQDSIFVFWSFVLSKRASGHHRAPSCLSVHPQSVRVLPGISQQSDREDPIKILSFRFFQLFQGHQDLLRGFCTISYPYQHCLPEPAFVQRAKYVCFCSANDSQQLRDFVPLFNFLPVG